MRIESGFEAASVVGVRPGENCHLCIQPFSSVASRPDLSIFSPVLGRRPRSPLTAITTSVTSLGQRMAAGRRLFFCRVTCQRADWRARVHTGDGAEVAGRPHTWGGQVSRQMVCLGPRGVWVLLTFAEWCFA